MTPCIMIFRYPTVCRARCIVPLRHFGSSKNMTPCIMIFHYPTVCRARCIVPLRSFPLRDFQKLNSPSCGMGILARLRLRAGRMPTPQEILRIFLSGSPSSKNITPRILIFRYPTVCRARCIVPLRSSKGSYPLQSQSYP